MAEPDLDLLLALEALLEESNVTRAAARLGLSQPALSGRLGRLRQLFGDPLFVPAAHGRGVVATPRVLELRPGLTDALGHLRALLRLPGGFDPRTSDRTFVIAAPEQPAAVLAPRLVRAVLGEAPGVRLAFVRPDADAAERLEEGTLDVLVAPPGRGDGALMARMLAEDEVVTAQRRGHPRGLGPLDLDGFCAQGHLVVSAEGGFAGFVDQALAALGRRRRVALSVPSYGLAPLVVAGSDVLCTLPRRLLDRHTDALDLFVPPLDLPRARLAAYWHARAHADPGHAWLRERLYGAAGTSARLGPGPPASTGDEDEACEDDPGRHEDGRHEA